MDVCGLYMDCKNWKEKVFVLRDYIYTYMFCLRSGMFGAAIEKKREKMSYTRIAERKQTAEKQNRKARFYYRKCVRFECEKIV